MSSFTPHLDGWYDVAEQMHADLARRAHARFAARQLEKEALLSVQDFEAYRDRVRAHFLKAIGGLPQEKTPLRPRITGVLQQPGFRIEKLLFESVPDYFVSAACYVPDGLTEPAPAVLFFCGHAALGKAHETYQRVCRDLAQNGFIVLAIDPIGQGERLQYWRDGKPWLDVCTVEHTHAGLPFFLQGASVARHFVWDGIRAFDYLASRADVDASRIGVTGNSGGGTQTCYLMLCEPRLAAAAPCTFPTTLEALFKSGNVQDMEQIVPGCFVHGPDHDDFLSALAPRPVMAGAVAYDQFPIEGSHEAVARARKVYELYGEETKLQLVVDNALHCYSDGLRQASVNWFKFHLKGEVPNFVAQNSAILSPEKLWVTQTGQILLDLPHSRTIFDLNPDHAEAVKAYAEPGATSPEKLRRRLQDVLGVAQGGSRNAPIFPRPAEPTGSIDGTTQQKIWFFSAPDIAVSGVLHTPREAGEAPLPCTLLIHENGTRGEVAQQVQRLLEAGRRVFVFDVRGVGGVASRSLSALDGHAIAAPFDTEYKLGCDAAMLGLSTVGLRVFDVLRGLDYLQSRKDTAEVDIHGIGAGATWAYFAAVLEPNFAAVTCEDMLLSYRDLCAERFYDSRRFAHSIMAWGLLRGGDMEDLLPCLADRRLRLVSPRDAVGDVCGAEGWGGELGASVMVVDCAGGC